MIRNLDNVEDFYPLTPLQEGLVFHSLASPGSGVYFNQCLCTLRGNIDSACLRRAWQEVVDRHAILRTFFVWEGLESPVQVVDRHVELPFEERDLSALAANDRVEQLQRLLDDLRAAGFDPRIPPLMRIDLVRTTDAEHELIWSFHHLYLDGWSMFIVLQEVFALYERFRRGEPTLSTAPRPFRDYVVWLKQQDHRRAQLYWEEALGGFTTPTPLPGDSDPAPSSSAALGPASGSEEVLVSAAVKAALESLAKTHRVTLNTLVQLAWGWLLRSYSGESDVVFGTVVSGRPAALAGYESMVGLFINTLPVRVELSPRDRVADAARELQRRLLELNDYAYCSLVDIQGWSDVARDHQLFDSILLFENYRKGPSLEQMGASLGVGDVRWFESVSYPLAVLAIPEAGLRLRILYQRPRFDAASAQRVLGHLAALLESMAARPEARLSELSMLTVEEQRRVLVEWNDTATGYPRDATVHQLFEEQARRTPEAEAVVFEGHSLTYRELSRRADRLARLLRRRGVRAGTRVGLFVERSLEMIVGMLAVLEVGGCYVPLDPGYPKERLAFMACDSGIRVLLTQEPLLDRFPQHDAETICLDKAPETSADASGASADTGVSSDPDASAAAGVSPDVSADDRVFPDAGSAGPAPARVGADAIAYVMYTSGSTGQPKGAEIPHRAIVRLVKNTDYAHFGADETFLQFAPISFDASTFEIWGSLLNGARLVLFPPHAASLDELGRFIESEGITTVWLTAGLFHQMIDRHAQRLRGVRQLLAGGDVLSVPHITKALRELPGCRLINGYGPTENTTFTCCHPIRGDEPLGQSVPIGRPIANTRVYILDDELQPVPVGVKGELCIAGDGLAAGYLNRPRLTAERFVSRKIDEGLDERLYRTGDRARYLPDGRIEFLGRSDFQIKVRGFRVEPGEIEAALGQHPNVRQAVVAAPRDGLGERQLTAYVVAERAPALTVDEMRRFLGERLPAYMLPQQLVCLDRLPLTANGKVDREALPLPEAARPDLERDFVAPRTELERAIARIWQEALGMDRVGVYDNFFDLGGHSLLVMQIHGKLRGLDAAADVSVVDMFNYPTIDGLARHLGGTGDRATFDEVRQRAERQRRAVARRRLERPQRPDAEH